MIAALIFSPMILAIVLLLVKSKLLNKIALVFYAFLHLILSILLTASPQQFTAYFKIDDLNSIFLLVLSVVFLAVILTHMDFLKHSPVSKNWETYSAIFLLLFVSFMSGVLLTTHAALVWVFVEAASLMASPLIYFSQSRSSLEGAWKYIFICSIGISLAFVGIIFLSIGSEQVNSLFFADLYQNADQIVPFWLKLAFPIILIGLGTKMGLAPGHSWLPDAHSEAPYPISAMLSAALLNSSLLGILRFFKILEKAHFLEYARTIILIMGFFSVFIAAVFIMRSKNYKRMLAYSSIENMGIISIGIGVGGAAIFGALIHVIAHSFTKASFFLLSGNIINLFKTKKIEEVSGLVKSEPFTGWLWLTNYVALSGLPPFPIFLSEFFIIKGMIEQGYIWMAIVFFLLLTIILFGMGKKIFQMSFGKVIPPVQNGKLTFLSYFSPVFLLIILLIMGIFLPPYIYDLIQNAMKVL